MAACKSLTPSQLTCVIYHKCGADPTPYRVQNHNRTPVRNTLLNNGLDRVATWWPAVCSTLGAEETGLNREVGMRGILTAVLAMVAVSGAMAEQKPDREVIAMDTVGVVVMVKEQYGASTLDTCTVVMFFRGNFVLVHRATGSSWYPASFNSIQVLAKLSQKPQEHEAATENQPLAVATGDN